MLVVGEAVVRALTGALSRGALHLVARRPGAQLLGKRTSGTDVVEARGFKGCGTKQGKSDQAMG